MRRGTTPTLVFTPSRDLSDYARVILTLRNKGKNIDLEGERLQFSEGSFSVTLTQEETLALAGETEAQVRAITSDEVAIASDIVRIDVDRILKDGVIEV